MSVSTPHQLSPEHAQKPQAAAPDRALLDLSVGGVRSHWRARGVDGLIAAMESCEPWAVDARMGESDAAERVIANLSRAFNSAPIEAIAGSVNADSELVLSLMGFLRSGR